MMLAMDPTLGRRTRHIKMCWHYMLEQVKKNKIKLHKVKTDDNGADLHTKATSADKVQHLIKYSLALWMSLSKTPESLEHRLATLYYSIAQI